MITSGRISRIEQALLGRLGKLRVPRDKIVADEKQLRRYESRLLLKFDVDQQTDCCLKIIAWRRERV